MGKPMITSAPKAPPNGARVPEQAGVRARFEAALDRLVERAKADPYVLAVILCGSLSYDTVWDKSDIDLLVVTRDEKATGGKRLKRDNVALVENGVNVHVWLQPRATFRKSIEGALRGSFVHSFLSKSRLLYSRDSTVAELYEDLQRMGNRDQQVQLLRAASFVLPGLYKAEKWFKVKKDYNYAFFYLMNLVTGLAQIEVALAGQIAGREVIQQALALNPAFFAAIYTDLANARKTEKAIAAALGLIDSYLTKKIRVLFGPILDYLSSAGSVRSAGEIDAHFKDTMDVGGVSLVCEWLADKDVITKASSPVRLTDRSRVEFEELAFYYDGDARGTR